MATKSTIDMKPVGEVIKDLGFDRTGDIQQYTTHRAKVRMDMHVPSRTKTLRRTAYENYDEVVYPQPYARRMYFGVDFNFNEAPQRGAFWDKKMLADQGEQFYREIQNFANKRG